MIALGTDGAREAGAVDAVGGAAGVRGVAGALEAGVVDAAGGGAVGNLRNTFDCVDAGDAVRAVDVDCVLLDVKFAELIVLAACVSDFIAADSPSVS